MSDFNEFLRVAFGSPGQPKGKTAEQVFIVRRIVHESKVKTRTLQKRLCSFSGFECGCGGKLFETFHSRVKLDNGDIAHWTSFRCKRCGMVPMRKSCITPTLKEALAWIGFATLEDLGYQT